MKIIRNSNFEKISYFIFEKFIWDVAGGT